MNIPPFYIGQRVVVITSTPFLKTGDEYTVQSLYYKSCCKSWTVHVGITDNGAQPYCPIHKTTHGIEGHLVHHNAKYFAPIESNFEAISYTKVMEEESPLVCVN